jgi:hypothetical protein
MSIGPLFGAGYMMAQRDIASELRKRFGVNESKFIERRLLLNYIQELEGKK